MKMIQCILRQTKKRHAEGPSDTQWTCPDSKERHSRSSSWIGWSWKNPFVQRREEILWLVVGLPSIWHFPIFSQKYWVYVIIPIDFHSIIFQRGGNQPPTSPVFSVAGEVKEGWNLKMSRTSWVCSGLFCVFGKILVDHVANLEIREFLEVWRWKARTKYWFSFFF